MAPLFFEDLLCKLEMKIYEKYDYLNLQQIESLDAEQVCYDLYETRDEAVNAGMNFVESWMKKHGLLSEVGGLEK